MQPILGLPFIFFIASTASAIFNSNSRGKTVGYKRYGDVGPKLILTPYIEAGKIQEARNLSFVQPFVGDVESYSGFLTVDKKCDSNLFFWFFPAENGMEDAPVLLWLQGGPGMSSMFGLFSQNGPYMLTPSHKLRLRKYSWTRFSSIIYIDNPVGTGYSYAKNEDCYSKTEEEVSGNLLLAVKQIMELFPEMSWNPFFIAGESYAGKYAPALAYAIHIDNDPSQIINLQGMAIGNGFVDPTNQLDYSEYLYQLGLLDDHGKANLTRMEDKCRMFIYRQKWKDATLFYGQVLLEEILSTTGFEYYFNYFNPNWGPNNMWKKFVTSDLIRKQIHVGNATLHDPYDVLISLANDVMQSVKPWLEELLEHYRVLIYNGQFDIVNAYPLTEKYLQTLTWSAAGEYENADRNIWRVDNSIAGYTKTAGKLTEVMVRNAGHMVAVDQPKWAFDLLSKFVKSKSF